VAAVQSMLGSQLVTIRGDCELNAQVVAVGRA
jgi:hypothetical protein